jgi:hypothetical protein
VAGSVPNADRPTSILSFLIQLSFTLQTDCMNCLNLSYRTDELQHPKIVKQHRIPNANVNAD